MEINPSVFWRIFEKTGSIKAYLAYKKFFIAKKAEKN